MKQTLNHSMVRMPFTACVVDLICCYSGERGTERREGDGVRTLTAGKGTATTAGKSRKTKATQCEQDRRGENVISDQRFTTVQLRLFIRV